MNKFTLNTTLPFPLLKITNNVAYSEVKKPTGISYMLLVLLKDSPSPNENLTEALSSFGVPKNLHYIYADAIQEMINDGVLTMIEKLNYDKTQFSRYLLNAFKFTDKGTKVFKDESIPTGASLETNIITYYEIPYDTLTLETNSDIVARPTTDSALKDIYMSQFKCDKDIEEFLNSKKGNGISIKKEEVIIKNEVIKQEFFYGNYEAKIDIDGDSLNVSFEDNALKDFFRKKYKPEIFTNSLSFKNKFKFAGVMHENVKLSSFKNFEIIGLKIPQEINEITKRKSILVISNPEYVCSSAQRHIENKNALVTLDNKIEIIEVESNGNVLGFSPCKVMFSNDVLGDVFINLVVVLKLSIDQLKLVTRKCIADFGTIDNEKLGTVLSICSVAKDDEEAIRIISEFVSGKTEENITKLREIKELVQRNRVLKEAYDSLVEKNLNQYVVDFKEDTLANSLAISSWAIKYLGLDEKTFVDKVVKAISPIKSSIDVYEAFVNIGFRKESILVNINPLPEVASKKKASEKILLEYLNYINNLDELKVLTGIKDYHDFSINEDEVDKNAFKKSFNSAFNCRKDIEVFRPFSKDIFTENDHFYDVFFRINDNFNLLDIALANPNNIKKETIEKKISLGDFQFVLINLSGKLETILRNKFKLEGTLSVMLSTGRRDEILDRNIATDLHDFREARNALAHPKDRKGKFTANDVRRWANEIFELEEEKK